MVTRFAEHPAQRADGGRECIHLNCHLLYSGSGVRIPDGAQRVPLNSIIAAQGHFLLSGYVWASVSVAEMSKSVTCGFVSGLGRFGDLTLNREYRESSFGSHAADLRVVCRIRTAGKLMDVCGCSSHHLLIFLNLAIERK